MVECDDIDTTTATGRMCSYCHTNPMPDLTGAPGRRMIEALAPAHIRRKNSEMKEATTYPDERSPRANAEDYTNPDNGHNPYEEVERLKKAMKIAIIALQHNEIPTEMTCHRIARQIRCNKPSKRTVELVQELVRTNATYVERESNRK